MKDKRVHQRIQLLRKLTVLLANGEEMVLDVLDYSMGGISALSKREFPVGALLQLEALTTLDGDKKRLGLTGEVKHVRGNDQGFVIGMMFKENES
ncbi:MAG: PilZ domain-containing protein [Gammaproteobacteria bacterium]|nr:PilZ domain-containing protein [Gammaproteobacteria bacterium]MDH5651938.1 PilZ domain-containing protein [Gammaproteobacteria bacterium]